jgi:hypothetical protein
MTPLIVNRFEAVEIGDDDGDRERPLAFQKIELIDIE